MPDKKLQEKNKFTVMESDLQNKALVSLFAKYKSVVSGADILEKAEFSRQDFLLVAGAIKPAIDFEFPEQLLSKLKNEGLVKDADFSDFKERLGLLGLKMSKVENIGGMLHAFIYNPELLVLRSQILGALIPFSEIDDLDIWITDNIDTNIDRDMVYGSLYGFPQSSIDCYIKYKRETRGLHRTERFGAIHDRKIAKEILKIMREERRHFVQSFGESYLVDSLRAIDIIEYENLKKSFFANLQANSAFWEVILETKKEAEANEDKLSWDIDK